MKRMLLAVVLSMFSSSGVYAQKIDNSDLVPGIMVLTNETDAIALEALAQYAAYWPPSATASGWFTFVTNSGAITITGYNITGGTHVVIPDYINGRPVTEIGNSVFFGSSITTVGGAGNVVTVGDDAFYYCNSLTSLSLPRAQTVGDGAFYYCGSLDSVSLPLAQTVGASAFESCSSLTSLSLPQAQTVGDYAFMYCKSQTSLSLPQAQTVGIQAFYYCNSLTSLSLPQAQTVGDYAFMYCNSLTSVYFGGNAPAAGTDIFSAIAANQVTVYVTDPQATGWGATLGGMPVVRPPLYAGQIYENGVRVATTQQLAEAIAAIPVPDMSSRVAVSAGVATNLTTRGWLALPQSQPTNLIMRLVASNDVIMAIGVTQ